MKKSTIRFLGISLGIAAVALLPHGLWLLTPARSLDVVVLDKNVAMERVDRRNNIRADYRKHIGLFWVLRNERYVKPDTRELYDPARDYVGPVLNPTDNTVEVLSLSGTDRHADLLYLADAYGVETDDAALRGVAPEDMDAIEDMAEHGTMVVGEFNLASYPTGPAVRGRLERLFGIGYSGWTGRYCLDLADREAVPAWARELYGRMSGKTWDFQGSGLILVSEDDKVAILREGIDYRTGSFRVTVLPEHADRFGALSSAFYDWFEVVEETVGSDVMAVYRIGWTGAAPAAVPAAMADGEFAAVVGRRSGNRISYYFAGEFCDDSGPDRRHDAIVAEWLNQGLYFSRKGDQQHCFCKFYVPLMEELCQEAYSETGEAIRRGVVEEDGRERWT